MQHIITSQEYRKYVLKAPATTMAISESRLCYLIHILHIRTDLSEDSAVSEGLLLQNCFGGTREEPPKQRTDLLNRFSGREARSLKSQYLIFEPHIILNLTPSQHLETLTD